jgi:hypothetical protein
LAAILWIPGTEAGPRGGRFSIIAFSSGLGNGANIVWRLVGRSLTNDEIAEEEPAHAIEIAAEIEPPKFCSQRRRSFINSPLA